MTERERLIELLSKAPKEIDGSIGIGKIADHLLENGVIVMPCKVGDIVYKTLNGKIYDMRVVAIPLLISTCGAHLSVTAANSREACISLDIDDFGKTVFLSREEAEKALKEREDK